MTDAPSNDLFRRACRVMPGGVNSPVRSFSAVGGVPVFIHGAAGSRLYTEDGRELLDFCSSWGPLILGHAHPKIVEAIRSVVGKGTSFGANTLREVEFAEMLCECVPYLEQVRLTSSGTEAAMSALRLARGVTGRKKILKFDGCYHGHSDSLLVAAGSGLLTGGTASSDGILPEVAKETLVAPYNDGAAVDAVVREQGAELAAIIVEPIAANMGLVMPKKGFLEGLRASADRCGALLVFDEVITGFRLGATTYGHLCGTTPDITCLGKIVGGGLPLGAIGGKREIMAHLAPLGKVYQAGTLSGNPVALAAGMATLRQLVEEPPYQELACLGRRLADGLNTAVTEHNIPAHCVQHDGMFTLFFSEAAVCDSTTARSCDTQAYAGFFHALLDRDIYLPPSQFEVGFVSAAHQESDIDRLIDSAKEAWRAGRTPRNSH